MMTPEERAAWATSYRLYEEFVPQLVEAAEHGDTDKAADLFGVALDRVTALHENSLTGSIMALPLFEMLENAYNAARERAQERPQLEGGKIRQTGLRAS